MVADVYVIRNDAVGATLQLITNLPKNRDLHMLVVKINTLTMVRGSLCGYVTWDLFEWTKGVLTSAVQAYVMQKFA